MSTRLKFAHFLRDARVEAGFSQQDVAKRLGYASPQFVSNWERGLSSPPCHVLWQLANLYRVSAEALYDLMLQETLDRIESDLRDQFMSGKPASRR